MKTFIRQRSFAIFIFFAFLACAVIAPIASNHFFPNLADYINHLAALINAKLALDEGQFPLRIAPTALQGYRYPFFQFYSPSLYLLGGAIYKWLTPADPLLAFRTVLWLGLLIGGLYMYKLANWLVKSWQIAVIAGVVYLTAPYYLIVINHLGNLAESCALGLVPVVVYYSLKRLFEPTNNWHFLKGVFAWYMLITIHIPTAIYTAIFLYGWLFIIVCSNRKLIQPFIATLISFAFGCLLALWYLLPIQNFSTRLLVSSTYTSAEHFILFSPLLAHLLSPSAILTTQSKSAMITIHPAVGWPILFAAAVCLLITFNKIKVTYTRNDALLRALTWLFVIAFVMAWSPFNFWRFMPSIFFIGQYSWRLLGQVSWMGALLFAWSLMWFAKNKVDNKTVIILVFLLVMMTSSWFPQRDNYQQVIEDFQKKPLFVYNDNAYALNFNDNTNLVDAIDNMLLYSLMDGDKLQLNKRYVFPQALLNLTQHPEVVIEGKISSELGKHHVRLQAVINGKHDASYLLRAGEMHWRIPLNVSHDHDATLHFVAIPPLGQDSVIIPIKKIILTGFSSNENRLSVTKVKPYCKMHGSILKCNVDVGANIKFVELPVLYYPGMQKIFVNGKEMEYHSVVFENDLLTTVAVKPNQLNTIMVRFTGIRWANWVSAGGWLLWLGLFGLCFWQKKKK